MRFSNFKDLPPDTIWITSLDRGEFVEYGLSVYDHLKHAAFLSTPTHLIAREIGYNTSEECSSEPCIRHIAEIISRTVSLSARRFGIEENFLQEKIRTARDFYEVIMGALSIVGNDILIDGDIRQALNRGRTMPGGGKFSKTLMRAFVTTPRYLNAMTVQEIVLPRGRMDEMEIIDNSIDVAEWLMYGMPVLCRVRIVSPGILESVMPRYYLQGHEFWVAHPELIILLNLGIIEISRCIMASSCVALAKTVNVTLTEPESLDILSVSSGLMAENYMAALASPILAVNENLDANMARSTWVTSALRANHLLFGMRIAQYGISIHEVTPYGIYILIPTKELHNTQKIIAGLGGVLCTTN